MCDLQVFGWSNLADMTSVGSTDQVAIVAQFDTLENRQYTPRFFIDGSKPAGKLVQKSRRSTPATPRISPTSSCGLRPTTPPNATLWSCGIMARGGRRMTSTLAIARRSRKHVKGGETRAGTRGERLRRYSLFLTTAGDIMAIEDDETRGICYDDSSMDFLDNRKMVEALQNAETAIGTANLPAGHGCLPDEHGRGGPPVARPCRSHGRFPGSRAGRRLALRGHSTQAGGQPGHVISRARCVTSSRSTAPFTWA